MSAAPALRLSLQMPDGRHRRLLPRHRVQRWVLAALRHGGHAETPAEITVRIVSAEEGRRLNREFRHKDYATNVLTFDYARAPVLAADLVVCAPVVEDEARASDIDLEAHYAHLVVHGTLHACGFDHERARDARVMEPLESAVMRSLGYADPYLRAVPALAARPQRVRGNPAWPNGLSKAPQSRRKAQP